MCRCTGLFVHEECLKQVILNVAAHKERCPVCRQKYPAEIHRVFKISCDLRRCDAVKFMVLYAIGFTLVIAPIVSLDYHDPRMLSHPIAWLVLALFLVPGVFIMTFVHMKIHDRTGTACGWRVRRINARVTLHLPEHFDEHSC